MRPGRGVPLIQHLLSPGSYELVTSTIASGDGLKHRRTTSGFLCRYLAMSISSEAPCSPRGQGETAVFGQVSSGAQPANRQHGPG